MNVLRLLRAAIEKAKPLAFHEVLGVLGVGDLHPGGPEATEFLLAELEKGNPRTVLEVGAGIGTTTGRMMRRGWRVVPIEPSDVLRAKLERTLGIEAHAGGFESFEANSGTFDAVIGESVFYGTDLRRSFEKAHRLLRSGGLLASLDTVWTAEASPDRVANLYDETKRIFGIPVGSRQALTWSDWRVILAETGFAAVVEKQIPAGSLRKSKGTRRKILRSAVQHPLAFIQHLNHRRGYRINRIPPGWTETWMGVWKRV
jgi:SAM-dependent methyltransferase